MNSLPYELFCSIISLLDHKNRCETSLVCHNWYQRLQHSGLLLQTIYTTDINKHQAMKRFFENASTSLRNKVDTIYYDWKTPFSMNELLELNELFPNIEEIQLLITPPYFQSASSRDRMATNANNNNNNNKIPFWAHLKRIRESSVNMHTLSILEHYSLEHLVRLELKFEIMPNQNPETTGDYFSYFKNAPRLEHLTLWYVHITYGELDILHENSPSIKELILFHASFYRHPAGPYTRIHEPIRPIHYTPTPADTVKVIRMYDVSLLGAIPLISYVASKYKRLSTLIITSLDVYATSQFQPHALELCLDDMTHFTCDLVEMTPELLRRFSMHVLNLTSFEIREGENCSQLLSILASTRFRHDVKSLVIRNNMYQHETCLNYIAQLENLESLVIEARKEPVYGEDEDFEDHYPYEDEDFEYHPCEEEEDEEFYRPLNAEEWSMSLNILDRLSKLKHLSITSFHIYIDEPIKENNSLERLEIMDCTIENHNVFDSVSSCLHLKKLSLFCNVHNMSFETVTNTKKQKKKDRKIRLKLLHLPFLEKVDVWFKGYPSLRYRDPEGKKSWYDMDRNGGYVTYYPSKKMGEGYFILECQSADLFYIPRRYNVI